MNKLFEIDAMDQLFYGNDDVCSHGHISLIVDGVVISDKEDADWTLNESALAMLRSVKYGFPNSEPPPTYFIDGFEEDTMIYHCGCYMLFCPSRITWKVKHDDKSVQLSDFIKYPTTNEDDVISYEGLTITMQLKEYAEQVYRFAIKVLEHFELNEIDFTKWEHFDGQHNNFWKEYRDLLRYTEQILN